MIRWLLVIIRVVYTGDLDLLSPGLDWKNCDQSASGLDSKNPDWIIKTRLGFLILFVNLLESGLEFKNTKNSGLILGLRIRFIKSLF